MPSERPTRALAVHMNGIRGDPSTLHCRRLPVTTGSREGRAVDMLCDAVGLYARCLRRTAALMIRATFLRTEPYEALEVAQ